MPPMSQDQSTENIVDADVVEDPEAPANGEETVQAVPVLAEVRTIASPPPAMLPAVQAAAVAATGFVAGAATLALVKRHSARKLARSRQSRRAVDALPIIGSRSFLVDVHLIAKPGE
jgi:hypothetical protein